MLGSPGTAWQGGSPGCLPCVLPVSGLSMGGEGPWSKHGVPGAGCSPCCNQHPGQHGTVPSKCLASHRDTVGLCQAGATPGPGSAQGALLPSPEPRGFSLVLSPWGNPSP